MSKFERIADQNNDASLRRAVRAARSLLKQGQLRDELFPSGPFADPSWFILLDLFVAQFEGREVSVSSACIASRAATSTALRHLNRLEEAGHVVRRGDPEDARRDFVTISMQAHTALSRVLFARAGDASRAAGPERI